MPIVTLTEENQTNYHAVTGADECRLTAVVSEYELSAGSNREYVEHALQTEYLKRLTEHAYDCAQLAHFVENPPEADDLLGNLDIVNRLMRKVVESAVWLRTYDPFTGLTAEVIGRKDEHGAKRYGTGMQIDGECVSALDDDSWEATRTALWARGPWRRDEAARFEREKAEKEIDRKYTPAGQKLVDNAATAFRAAVDRALKLKERSRKTVANKTLRRRKAAR